MTSDPSSWKEAKPPYNPGPITNFRRGYRVETAGRHESDQQYRAFCFYMNMGAGRSYVATAEVAEVSEATIQNWADKYEWQRRAAHHDKTQMTLALKDANKIERRKHRDSIEKFRSTQQEQAEKFTAVSNDLLAIIQKRIEKADAEGEDIPMGLVSGLMRAAANISEQGRQAWATSLGVNELMQVVDQELEAVNVEDVTDIDEIPLDE
ncbi:terminase small subunit [Synechococcus phage S-CRES3]|nr:terminase small subunit [Synechococcus phage S-CRES3]